MIEPTAAPVKNPIKSPLPKLFSSRAIFTSKLLVYAVPK
jgi:hypothetical protein